VDELLDKIDLQKSYLTENEMKLKGSITGKVYVFIVKQDKSKVIEIFLKNLQELYSEYQELWNKLIHVKERIVKLQSPTKKKQTPL